MPEPRKPDAILCPRDYPATRRGEDRDDLRNRQLGRLLGVKRVHSRTIAGVSGSFVTPSVKDTMLFAKAHPMQGEDRYEWFLALEGPDGTLVPIAPAEGDLEETAMVKFGYLRDDPFAEDEATKQAMEADRKARMQERMADPERRRRMVELGLIAPAPTEDEAKEKADDPKVAPSKAVPTKDVAGAAGDQARTGTKAQTGTKAARGRDADEETDAHAETR